MPDQLTMHRAFLAEIRAKREFHERELQRLTAVEAYHSEEVTRLEAVTNGSDNVHEQQQVHITDPRLDGLKRHDACEIALHELGGRSATPGIVKWLVARGYGAGQELRIFTASCFTAMSRKPAMFRKHENGEWEAITKSS